MGRNYCKKRIKGDKIGEPTSNLRDWGPATIFMRVSPSLYTPSPGKDASKNINFYARAPKRKHTELVFVLRPAHGSLGTSKFGEMAILGANRFNLEKSLF